MLYSGCAIQFPHTVTQTYNSSSYCCAKKAQEKLLLHHNFLQQYYHYHKSNLSRKQFNFFFVFDLMMIMIPVLLIKSKSYKLKYTNQMNNNFTHRKKSKQCNLLLVIYFEIFPFYCRVREKKGKGMEVIK